MRTLLRLPAFYRLFRRAVGGRGRDRFAEEFIGARPGDRVLDIGCGPGDILAHLPRVDYVGIDLDANYIRAARQRYGALGEFFHESVEDTVVRDPGTFDIVLAVGVLHHLDDRGAGRLLAVAREALKPGGRLVALDGCFVPEQSPAARLMLKLDRGRFVRAPEEYRRLAAEVFPEVHGEVCHDLIRIPYTHHILLCRNSGGSPQGARG